jgi:hypothetical protein
MAANVFGLTWAELHCNEHTTLDEFGVGILVKEESNNYFTKEDAESRTRGEVLKLQSVVSRLTLSSFTQSHDHQPWATEEPPSPREHSVHSTVGGSQTS